MKSRNHRKYHFMSLLCECQAYLTSFRVMNGASQAPDARRGRYSAGIKNVVIYCAFFSLLFVLTSILVEIPIMSMMISPPRKMFGIMVFVSAISFFAVFSFKSSRSSVCWLPFIFVLVLVACPVFLLLQEPQYLFNYANTESEVLPFCKKSTEPLPDPVPNTYVVFRPTNTGLGNRMLALVSSYALALATGRQLLVDWQLTEVFGARFEDLFRSKVMKNMRSVIGNVSVSENEYDFLNLVYCRQCSIRFRHPNYALLATKDLRKEFTKKFIVVRSNVYFAPTLLVNKHHRKSMCSLVANGTSLFTELFHRSLKITKELQEELDEALQAFEGKYPIGVQLRTKDRVGFPMTRMGSFFNCLQTLVAQHNNSLVIVASDTESLKRKAQLLFGDKVYRTKRKSFEYTREGIKAALMDLVILSRCKELILTPFSTFGAVAAGIGRIVPHFVTREEGYCVKDVSYEPKFHYWHAMSLYHIDELGSSYMVNQDDSFL